MKRIQGVFQVPEVNPKDKARLLQGGEAGNCSHTVDG